MNCFIIFLFLLYKLFITLQKSMKSPKLPLAKYSSKVKDLIYNEWRNKSDPKEYKYKAEPKSKYKYDPLDYERATSMNRFPWIHITKKMNANKKRFILEELYDIFLKLIICADDFKTYIIEEKPMNERTFNERRNFKIDGVTGLVPQMKTKILPEGEITLDVLGSSTGSSLNTVAVSIGEFSISYCYCKKDIMGSSLLVGCEKADKCPNGGWYHQDCVAELRGKSKDEIEKMKWYCPECKERKEGSYIDEIESLDFSTNKMKDKNSETYAFDLTKDNNLDHAKISDERSDLKSDDISSDPESDSYSDDDSYDADLNCHQDANNIKENQSNSSVSKVSSSLSDD